MKTLRLFVDANFAGMATEGDDSPDAFALQQAAGILRGGGTVAFATETVYGLGANALDSAAVEKIFVAKQRPAWDPLIVHVVDEAMLARVAAAIPVAARALMDHFWPGPLTLLVPRHPDLPDAVTAGLANVAVRVPAHLVAQALIRQAGVPIAAPSANTFGHVSPTIAAHVAADLDGRIDAILDSGETRYGLESTVVDASIHPCMVYRPGAITLEQLQAVWPHVERYAGGKKPAILGRTSEPSPGLGLRHYAPRARLVLVEEENLALGLEQALLSAAREQNKTGLMLPEGLGLAPALSRRASAAFAWGRWSEPAELAHRLFLGLRELDAKGVDVIVCPLPHPTGLGIAIIDRLRKAARRG